MSRQVVKLGDNSARVNKESAGHDYWISASEASVTCARKNIENSMMECSN